MVSCNQGGAGQVPNGSEHPGVASVKVSCVELLPCPTHERLDVVLDRYRDPR